MAVRGFNGSSDRIAVARGAVPTGAWTVMALFERDSNASALWPMLYTHDDATNIGRLALEITGTGSSYGAEYLAASSNTFSGDSAYQNANGQVVVADSWVLGGSSRAAGSAQTPRFHRMLLSAAGTWVHQNHTVTGGSLSRDDPPALGGGGHIGAFQNAGAFSDWFHGKIAVVAVWDKVLSDAEWEECGANLRTSDIQFNSAGPPIKLYQLAQTAVTDPVVDLSGNGGHEIGRSGTSIVAGDDPPGWTFDAKPLPHAADSSLFPKPKLRRS